jgi:hypothetical protein
MPEPPSCPKKALSFFLHPVHRPRRHAVLFAVCIKFVRLSLGTFARYARTFRHVCGPAVCVPGMLVRWPVVAPGSMGSDP